MREKDTNSYNGISPWIQGEVDAPKDLEYSCCLNTYRYPLLFDYGLKVNSASRAFVVLPNMQGVITPFLGGPWWAKVQGLKR